jgi:hypothetical protein
MLRPKETVSTKDLSGVREVFRCKFKCVSILVVKRWNVEGFLYTAEFAPVTGHEEEDPIQIAENSKHFEGSPIGSLRIGVMKQDIFVPGHEYYLDIVPVKGS